MVDHAAQRAGSGDDFGAQAAFAEETEPHRHELNVHARPRRRACRAKQRDGGDIVITGNAQLAQAASRHVPQ
jgi:hypothetical protein